MACVSNATEGQGHACLLLDVGEMLADGLLTLVALILSVGGNTRIAHQRAIPALTGRLRDKHAESVIGSSDDLLHSASHLQ